MLKALRNDLKSNANPEKAEFLKRFFKTGKGEYAEGDVFLGIVVPESRKIAAKYKDLDRKDVLELLHSQIHEERLIALFILIMQFNKADEEGKKKIYSLYLDNAASINNWDLVDSSADKIVGEYLWLQGDRAVSEKVLIDLAKSNDLWERRIAMLSTFAFINHGESAMTFTIADILLHDEHDLIHKAVGWLLREAGKKVSHDAEVAFLKTRYKTMPRTMLRYAIERFPEEDRKKYLAGTI